MGTCPVLDQNLSFYFFGKCLCVFSCDLTAGPVRGIQTAVSDLPRFPCLLPLCMMLRKDVSSVQPSAQAGGVAPGHEG